MVNLLLNSGASLLNGKPIVFLTQWKLMGNSEVHTDEYLTQWKVEGNSVVDNNTILSCGDYSDVDGKYHVKISNGVTIYDIPLTEPLRKVNDVADSIEFANGVAVVTRYLYNFLIGNQNWGRLTTGTSGKYRMSTSDFSSVSKHASSYSVLTNVIGAIYPAKKGSELMALNQGVTIGETGSIILYDSEYNTYADTFKAARADVEIIFELDTPTTEVIQVAPFPVSPTDTYTSANDTPYSAFEYKKNVEIWSCGEYNTTDGKYHILVQPEGGSIADIALDEPLRKVNSVADSIEFANGVATLTRKIASAKWNDLTVTYQSERAYKRFLTSSITSLINKPTDFFERVYTCLSSDFIQNNAPLQSSVETNPTDLCMAVYSDGTIYVRDTSTTSAEDFYEKYGTHEFLYRLATPTTETIQVPQIQDADSYTCVISQSGKAVEWSSFETE